ncbi:MAG: bifunctional 4-hydroxy-2-oxoglutarate aldolase/2-dehydro-3-deoxy-phosphogluconate aldolase [Verrucomicrobiota bacterium]
MNLVTELSRARILSAAVIDAPAHAVPLARALLAGGIGIMEVTFRNAHAAECIRHIRNEVPAMTVGAGTLLTPAQVDEAIKAGAQFGVSPGFNPTVVRHAVAVGFPFAPGVLTPGEMEQSLELGCPVVKFFPAAAAGGADFIKAIAAPYAHTSLRLIPLGGIGEKNLADYLALPIVIAVGGSWLTDRKLAAAGNWEEITNLTKRAVQLAAPKT